VGRQEQVLYYLKCVSLTDQVSFGIEDVKSGQEHERFSFECNLSTNPWMALEVPYVELLQARESAARASITCKRLRGSWINMRNSQVIGAHGFGLDKDFVETSIRKTESADLWEFGKSCCCQEAAGSVREGQADPVILPFGHG
jgi:hypothetical protein